MIYQPGTKLTCRDDGKVCVVSQSSETETTYIGHGMTGKCLTVEVPRLFIVDGDPLQTVTEALDDHDAFVWAYKALCDAHAAGLVVNFISGTISLPADKLAALTRRGGR